MNRAVNRAGIVFLLPLLLAPACAKRVSTGATTSPSSPSSPSSDPIVRIARALDDVSIAAGAGTDVVIAMVLPDDENRAVLRVFTEILLARIEAGKLLRDVNRLSHVDRASLTALLAPAFKRFRDASSLAVVGIKNPQSQDRVRAYVGMIEVAIATIELALELRR